MAFQSILAPFKGLLVNLKVLLHDVPASTAGAVVGVGVGVIVGVGVDMGAVVGVALPWLDGVPLPTPFTALTRNV